jgi:LPS-assembly protein
VISHRALWKNWQLQAVVVLLLFSFRSAQAQILDPLVQKFDAPPAAPAKPTPDDGLTGDGFYLEADTIDQDEDNHRTTARGSVEARYHGRVVRADEIQYDSDSGVITARGRVKIVNADGTALFADAITLDKDMTEGIALGFSTRLQGNVKIAAASAKRGGEQVTELDQVVFTPCIVCTDGGRGAPTWSIRAAKVVENHKRHTLHFERAVVQVKGIPLLYFPALTIADPTLARKSGFLLPLVVFSGERGFSYEQPYYQVISSSQDITLIPQINSKVNPFLNLDYRKRFYSGDIDIRAGYTYESDFTSGGEKFGNDTSHSYILSSGIFKPSEDWQIGFTGEQTSDKLLFQKYSIGNVFETRGLYAADDQRLISQAYAVRQDQLSYFSVAALEIQGLRSTDVQSSIPIVGPLIEGRWELAPPVLGGRLRLDASAAVLTFDQSPENPPPPNADSRRATIQSDWQRTFTLSNGLRLEPFLKARADLYNLTYLTPPPTEETVGRAFGTAGLNITYPLIRQSAGISYILEPIAQIAISPNASQTSRIPNDDSVIFQFDDTNLFDTNRSPGYDIYEGGQSITLGGRVTALLADGRSASLLLGRRFAAGSDPVIASSTGLQTALSDYILAAYANPVHGVQLFSRLRLDSDTFQVNRLETGAEFATERVTGYVSYLYERQPPSGNSVDASPGTSVNSLDIHAEAYVTRHWGLTSYAILNSGTWRRQEFGIVYRDDCLRFEAIYRHDQTFNGTLGPSSSVVLRLTLATLGNSGYIH